MQCLDRVASASDGTLDVMVTLTGPSAAGKVCVCVSVCAYVMCGRVCVCAEHVPPPLPPTTLTLKKCLPASLPPLRCCVNVQAQALLLAKPRQEAQFPWLRGVKAVAVPPVVAHALLQGPPVARFDFGAMKAQADQLAAHACTRPECFNGDHAHPPPPGRVAEGDADVDLGQTNVDAVFAMVQQLQELLTNPDDVGLEGLSEGLCEDVLSACRSDSAPQLRPFMLIATAVLGAGDTSAGATAAPAAPPGPAPAAPPVPAGATAAPAAPAVPASTAPAAPAGASAARATPGAAPTAGATAAPATPARLLPTGVFNRLKRHRMKAREKARARKASTTAAAAAPAHGTPTPTGAGAPAVDGPALAPAGGSSTAPNPVPVPLAPRFQAAAKAVKAGAPPVRAPDLSPPPGEDSCVERESVRDLLAGVADPDSASLDLCLPAFVRVDPVRAGHGQLSDVPWHGVLVEVCRDQLGGPFVGRVENSGVLYTVPTGQLHRFKPSAVTDLLCKLWATTRPYQDLVKAPGDQPRPPTVTKAYEVFTTVPVYASQALFVDGSVAGVLKDALPIVGKVRARALQLFRVFVGEALDSSGNGEFPPALHPHVRYILRACFRHCSPSSISSNSKKDASLPLLFHVVWERTVRRVAGVWQSFTADEVASVTGLSSSLDELSDHVFEVDLRNLLVLTRDQLEGHLAASCGVPLAEVPGLLDGESLPSDTKLAELVEEDVLGMSAASYVRLYHACRDPDATSSRVAAAEAKKQAKAAKRRRKGKGAASAGSAARAGPGKVRKEEEEEEEEEEDPSPPAPPAPSASPALGGPGALGQPSQASVGAAAGDSASPLEGPPPGTPGGVGAPPPAPPPAPPAAKTGTKTEEALSRRLAASFTLRARLAGAGVRVSSGQLACILPTPRLGPVALPLTRRVVGPVLRGALGRLEAEASTSSQGQAPAAAEALAARIAGLRAVLDAVPRNKDGSAQRDLPLQALFSSEHPVIKGLLQRYGALPATGAFTGKGVRFAIPVVKVVRLPPTTKAGTQWANVDVAAGKYRVAERQFVEGWRTTQDFVLGRPGKYKLHVVPRQPLPKGVPVVGCDPGVNCPLFTDTGVYLFSEDWYRARRLRIQSRKKPSNVRRAEGELATTIARAVGQLEYLEYVKTRGGEVRHGAGVGRAVVGCVVCVVCGVCVGGGGVALLPSQPCRLSPVCCCACRVPCPVTVLPCIRTRPRSWHTMGPGSSCGRTRRCLPASALCWLPSLRPSPLTPT